MSALDFRSLNIQGLLAYEDWFDHRPATDALFDEMKYRDIASRGFAAWTGSVSDQVVAVAFFSLSTTGHGNIYFAVKPTERRKGYGAEILSKTLAEPHIRNLVSTKVSVRSDNVAAQRVLQKTGFVVTAHGPDGLLEFEKL